MGRRKDREAIKVGVFSMVRGYHIWNVIGFSVQILMNLISCCHYFTPLTNDRMFKWGMGRLGMAAYLLSSDSLKLPIFFFGLVKN